MINPNCANSLLASTSNNPHETSTSELASIESSVNDKNRIANFIGFNIIEFPPEIHMEMCKYLDSQSMKKLRRTCKLFRDNVSIVVVRNKENKEILEKELKEAIGTGSHTSCMRIRSLLKKGVTLSLGKLTHFLKGAMMMDCNDGIVIARALRRVGASIPLEDLPQALRGALRLNGPSALQHHAGILLRMGATLPHEELADELRSALRTDSRAALARTTVIMNMGVTLPPVELPKFMKLALAMPAPIGVVHAMSIQKMMGVQPQG